MEHSNITATRPIENALVLKDKTEKAVSLKPEKSSTSKPNNKNTPCDNTLGLDPTICFYEIGDGDKTDEGEETVILVIHDSSLSASEKN